MTNKKIILKLKNGGKNIFLVAERKPGESKSAYEERIADIRFAIILAQHKDMRSGLKAIINGDFIM